VVVDGFSKAEFERIIARWMLKEADGETKITHPWKVSETDLWSQSDKVSQLTLRRSLLPYIGTAIKHPVPDQVKPSFVIFDIRTL